MKNRSNLEGKARYYANIMKEVKERTDEMGVLLKCEEDKLRPRSRFELLYLHVRMICEFIAIGCLVCHDASPQKNMSRFKGKYRADMILKRLTQLSSIHYPQAIRTKKHAQELDEFVPLNPQPLPAERLWKAYTKSDQMLHVGKAEKSIDNIFHQYDEIHLRDFHAALIAHLNCHTIHLTGTDRFIYVIMENGQGEVSWNILEEVPKG